MGYKKANGKSKTQEVPKTKKDRADMTPTALLSPFFFFNKAFFFFFWLRWVFVAARGLSLVAESRGYSSLRCAGFSLWWLLLFWSTGSRRVGFSSCGMQAQ